MLVRRTFIAIGDPFVPAQHFGMRREMIRARDRRAAAKSHLADNVKRLNASRDFPPPALPKIATRFMWRVRVELLSAERSGYLGLSLSKGPEESSSRRLIISTIRGFCSSQNCILCKARRTLSHVMAVGICASRRRA